MKTLALRSAVVFAALTLSACNHRLPPLKAEEIHSRTAVFGVVTTADASGISITETQLRAERAKWTISFPGFDHTTEATGYQQRREKEKP